MKKNKKTVLSLILLLCNTATWHRVRALKIDRVILSSNENPNYIQFWPIVARAWKEIIGVKPTLCFITDNKQTTVDESLGDVLYFKPIPGVSTVTHAQVIRLLAPAYFPNEVCIIADIDMLPLSRAFFVNKVRAIPNDKFVVYTAPYGGKNKRIAMCYNAARGSLFAQIFGVNNVKDIPDIIAGWNSLNLGWHTDETLLIQKINAWRKQHVNQVVFLNVRHMKDRMPFTQKYPYASTMAKERPLTMHYKPSWVSQGKYKDVPPPRPYEKHKKEIDHIFSLALKQVRAAK